MKNRFNKITALTLALLTLGAFASCGENEEEINDSQESSAEANSEEMPIEKRELRIAVGYCDDVLNDAAIRYNITHDDSRIQIVDYSIYDTEANIDGAAQQLKLDIISGKIPDLIDVSIIEGIGLEKFGIYTDLYTYLDSDEEFSRDSFIPGILDVSEKDGKLYSLPVTCNALYVYAGKSKFLADYARWETEDIIGAVEKYPDMLLYANRDNCSSLIFETFDLRDFIDFDNYTCNFDSSEFVRILDLCCQYPVTGVYNSISTENIKNENALVGMIKIHSIDEISQGFEEMFADEDYTLVKTSYNFGMRLAVTESCWNKEYAWDYIKELYDEEAYLRNIERSGYVNSLPVTVGQFDVQSQYLQNIEESDNLFNKSITSEESDFAYEILKSGNHCAQNMNYAIYMICYEETQRCFYGEISAQECAETIQGRVGIYLGENA